MSGFRNYQEQRKRRAEYAFGGVLVGAAALAYAPSRRWLTGAALEGLERLGRFATVDRKRPVQEIGAQLGHMLERASPRAARAAIGEQAAWGILESRLSIAGVGGTDSVRRLTNQIVSDRGFRRFLLDESVETRELLQEGTTAWDALQGFLSEQRGRGASALNRTHFEAMLFDARSAVPTLEQVQTNPALLQVQARLQETARQQLLQRNQAGRDIPGVARTRLGQKLGIGAVKLSDVPTVQGPWTDPLFTLLGDQAGDLHVGEMVRFNGRAYDLSGARQVFRQATGWMDRQLQIPLAPGAMGISPFQLFPWSKGRGVKFFDDIPDTARDATLQAALGSAGDNIGQTVYKVGERIFHADYTASVATDALQELQLQGEFRSGLYGFMKRRAVQLEEARAARGTDRGWDVLGLWNAQTGETLWDRGASVLQKFNDPTWAPNLLSRLADPHVPLHELDPQHFKRALSFLSGEGVSTAVQQRVAGHAAGATLLDGMSFTDPALQGALRNLGDERQVQGFFERLLELQGADEAQGFARSITLRDLLHQYRASPQSVMDRLAPATNRAVLGYNLAGRPEDLTGLDLMRKAILEEAEHRLALFTEHAPEEGFLNLVRGMSDLPDAERQDALAYGWGKLMGRRADPWVRGEATGRFDLMQDAVDAFRRSAEAQEAVEGFTRRHVKLWDAHVEPEQPLLRTSNLFVQHGMLGQLNASLRSGRSWSQAFGDTTGAGIRGVRSWFTGNPLDATADTVFMEHFPRKLNEYFSGVGIGPVRLGLAPEDLSSGGAVMGNLFAKRILPAFAAVEAWRYLDYRAEQDGTAGPSDLYANVRGNLGIMRARAAGESLLGIRRELLPGLDKFLPERSEEEERVHQASGYEAVRKGRFWSMGSRGEFWGEKVDYFLPSATRVARSDWQGAENADLNTRDYWAHHLLPTPENLFLGPVLKLFGNHDYQHWWERKHATGDAADRPYAVSGELADPNTLHGPLVNMTVGPFIKPREILRLDVLPTSLGGTASREQLRGINEAIRRGYDQRGVSLLIGAGAAPTGHGGFGGETFWGSPGYLPTAGTGGSGGGNGSGAGSGSGFGGGGGGSDFAPRGAALGSITPSGQLETRVAPAQMDGGDWGGLGKSSLQREGWAARLSRKEQERANRQMKSGMGGGGVYRPGASAALSIAKGPFGEEDLDLVNYQSGTITGARNLVDVAGIYGFMAEQINPIEQEGPIVATPQRAQGWNRRFYELEVGGLGGELSEVGRRFMARRQRSEDYNPIRNTMPGWLPGAEHYLDLQHGDPYTAVKRGELRLPGEAYERLHPEVKVMGTRASSLGKTEEEIMRGMIHLDEPLSDFGERVTAAGDDIHHALQMKWKRMGVLLGAEFLINNKELGITGHPDAILAMQDGPALTDIKTVSGKRFRQSQQSAFADHVSQLNFYLHELGMDNGFITYVNRDNPEQVHYQRVRYDEGRFQDDIAKVQRARARLQAMQDAGQISRGDLYDAVTRFEILSDVAPYSENYAQVREYLTAQNRAGELSDGENERFQAAKERTAAQKKRSQTYGYRFAGMDLKTQAFTVERILDPNTLVVEGSDNPLRLAGLKSSAERIEAAYGPTPEGMTPAEWQFAQFGIRTGSRISAAVEGDEHNRIAQDTLKTQHAVLYAGGKNVNRELLQRGVGEEKEGDWSDTGVAARFSPGEIRTGALWEQFAHLDTPLHTKFLKTRSPLEELERGIVFGKRSGGWAHPFRDYVRPTLESNAAKNPLVSALATGGFVSFFFSRKLGKGKAFLAGAAAGFALSGTRMLSELATGETWKPARTRTREELEEYWDTLKYLKNRRLAAQEERLARKEEGVDVDRMARDIYVEGQKREKRRHWLESQKRQIKLGRQKETDKANLDQIQDDLDRLAESKGMLKLGPHTAKALKYRDMFRSTLYGINPAETPFVNLFRAMPKYKRELVEGWINKSSQKERERIYELLPRQEQRVLGKWLGIDAEKIPDRPTLREFFTDHSLPDAKWEGWRPNVDLEKLRMRSLRYEGLDPMDSGIYELQVDEAESETRATPVPTLRGGGTAQIQKTLNELLSGRGLRNVRVTVDVGAHDGGADDLDLHLDLRQHREQDLRDSLQLWG